MRCHCARRKCRAGRQRVATMPRIPRAPSCPVEAIYEFAYVTGGTSLSSGFFSSALVGTTPAPERAERCNEMHSFNKTNRPRGRYEADEGSSSDRLRTLLELRSRVHGASARGGRGNLVSQRRHQSGGHHCRRGTG